MDRHSPIFACAEPARCWLLAVGYAPQHAERSHYCAPPVHYVLQPVGHGRYCLSGVHYVSQRVGTLSPEFAPRAAHTSTELQIKTENVLIIRISCSVVCH